MQAKGNREALRVLRASSGTVLVERLLAAASYNPDVFTLFADMHVRGSSAQKGIVIKYANKNDGVAVYVQAGGNGTRVLCKLKRKGRSDTDYEDVKERLEKALTHVDMYVKDEVSTPHEVGEREVSLPQPKRKLAPRVERFARPSENGIGTVLVELLRRTNGCGGEIDREMVVDVVASYLGVTPRGTGPFIRSMTTEALGIMEKTARGTFFVFTEAAKRYIDQVAISDAQDRYPVPDDAKFPEIVPFQQAHIEGKNSQSYLALSDESVLIRAERLRGDITEMETTIEAQHLSYNHLLRSRNDLLRRLGNIDQMMRMKAKEASILGDRHTKCVEEFWALFRP